MLSAEVECAIVVVVNADHLIAVGQDAEHGFGHSDGANIHNA